MFKNALVYRIDHWEAPSLQQVDQRLAAARFIECGATQMESAGWVEPRGEKHAALVESVAGQWILKLCTETKAVPSGVVKTQLEEQLALVEQQTGRRPKGKQLKAMKEDLVHSLLPRAFPRRSTTLVWVDAAAGLLLIDAASAKKADGVVTRLVDLLGGGLRLSPLQTELSPATAMAAWLSDKQAPAGFSIDRECELKQPDHEKSLVRYTRHTLEIDELAEHIRQGKLPTKLAMTWSDRVSFVLTEALALKKIKLLDVVIEGQGAPAETADAGFDTDVAISTGELSRMIPDLVSALGGVLQRERPALDETPAPDSVAPWDALPA
jgi:recombination associated protein RdgC